MVEEEFNCPEYEAVPIQGIHSAGGKAVEVLMVTPARSTDARSNRIGLPIRPFFYTPDQIASLLQLTEEEVLQGYLWYIGRNFGLKPKDRLKAINIAPDDAEPRWRVTEEELIVWLSNKGIRLFVKGGVR